MNSYFLCATQPGNLGDLVINKMLIEELCQYGKVFVDAYHLPNEFCSFLFENENAISVYDRYQVSLKRYQLREVISIIKDNQIELYTNSPGPLYLLPFLKQLAFLFIHRLISRQGVKVVNIGGCCSAALTKQSKVSRIGIEEYYLRSTQSVEYLKTHFNGVTVDYIPDVSLLLRYRVTPDYTVKSQTVAFSFRPIDQGNLIMRLRCIKLIKEFVKSSYNVVLFWQVSKDEEFVRSLYAAFDNTEAVSLHEGIVWYNNMSFYADKQYVVSNRLHSLLIGSVYGAVPVVFGDCGESCAKIAHVFSSLFKSTKLVNLWQYEEESVLVQRLISDLSVLQNDINCTIWANAVLCRDTIFRLVKQAQLGFLAE